MEKTSPKTIQIYLPGGDPRGIRVAEITTRIVRVIEIPRSSIEQFQVMPEASQVGLYFLFGNNLEDESIPLYIGQTGGCGERLKQHQKERMFWEKAVVVVSLTNSLTQTHVLFLESLAIAEARKIGRYSLLNGNGGNRPYTPRPLEADCHEIYETARILLTTLGHPVFEPVIRQDDTSQKNSDILFCRSSDADGRGTYTDEGFVVLKGSSGRRENVPSIKGTSDERFRDRLISDGVMRIEGDRVVFDKDHIFGSPSMAAVALTGRTANGWIEWKTGEGKTLQALKRETLSQVLPSNV